jgi:hypothetical protein
VDVEKQVGTELAKLAPGTTACPGDVARRLGRTQRELRPIFAAMAAAGTVRITQRGVPADLATVRGPYRVAAAGRDAASKRR